jgi:hypothetical protein
MHTRSICATQASAQVVRIRNTIEDQEERIIQPGDQIRQIA